MASKRKKNGVGDAPNLDLLPVMALMTVLIPILLSMASFQKLAVVEINMPERSMMNADGAPPEVDDQALNLSVAVGNDYLEIWARGGSMPKIFADEIIEYRCQTGDNFRYHPRYQIRYINEAAATGGHKWVQDKSFSGGQAKCLDGTPIPDTYAKGEKRVAQKEAIIMAARSTEGANSEEEVFGDPARLLRSVYNASDSAYVDGNLEFYTSKSQLHPGMAVQTLRENSVRKLGSAAGPAVDDFGAVYEDWRSAYDELAKVLVGIHNRFIDLPDADNIIVFAGDEIPFDKIIQVMDAARESGFWNIQLAKLGG